MTHFTPVWLLPSDMSTMWKSSGDGEECIQHSSFIDEPFQFKNPASYAKEVHLPQTLGW